MKKNVIIAALLLGGCGKTTPPPQPQSDDAPPVQVSAAAPQAPLAAPQVSVEQRQTDQAPAPQPVVSVYVEPPLSQPPPIRVAWAPPPMLVETPSPPPFDGAVWTGGYWVWEGNWVWAHGRWSAPPRPHYGWVNPYYEHRDGAVIFVNGFWAPPGVSFVPPPLHLNIAFGAVAAGVIHGPRPVGPEGVFVPPPPGSYFGLIVPAPIGTAPAVVTSAPPIIREGMRINVNNGNVTTINNHVQNINHVTNINNNVTNITNVTIAAPANAMANGRAFNTSVPAQAHLAAALPPVVKTYAPTPASMKPIAANIPGRAPVRLPEPQTVHGEASPDAMHHQPVADAMPANNARNTIEPAHQEKHSPRPSESERGDAAPQGRPANPGMINRDQERIKAEQMEKPGSNRENHAQHNGEQHVLTEEQAPHPAKAPPNLAVEEEKGKEKAAAEAQKKPAHSPEEEKKKATAEEQKKAEKPSPKKSKEEMEKEKEREH